MSTFNSLQATAHAHVKVLAKGKGGNTKFTCKHCNKQFTSFTHQVTGGCHAFVKLFFFLLCCSRVCSSLSQLIARFAVMPHPAAELAKNRVRVRAYGCYYVFSKQVYVWMVCVGKTLTHHCYFAAHSQFISRQNSTRPCTVLQLRTFPWLCLHLLTGPRSWCALCTCSNASHHMVSNSKIERLLQAILAILYL